MPDANQIKEINLERVFNAPISLVYRMWTEPKHFSNWYGPKGVTVAECELDVRPGGKFTINMKMPNGQIYPSPGIYREVIENKKIQFSLMQYDEQGNVQMEMLNTVTLEEREGKTFQKFNVVTIKTMPNIDPLKGLDRAWGQAFDKLEEALHK